MAKTPNKSKDPNHQPSPKKTVKAMASRMHAATFDSLDLTGLALQGLAQWGSNANHAALFLRLLRDVLKDHADVSHGQDLVSELQAMRHARRKPKP